MNRSEKAKTAAAPARRNGPHRICVFLKETFLTLRFAEGALLCCGIYVLGDLDMYEIMKAAYETCPDTYIRPDHGRMIWDEIGRPGYGLYDRALGIAYLNGLWEAIDKNAKRG